MKYYSIQNKQRDGFSEVFGIINNFAIWLEKMPDFSKVNPKKLRYGIFLALGALEKLKQTDFSKENNISQNSLSKWKHELIVLKIKNQVLEYYLEYEYGNVLVNLLNSALWTSSRTGRGDVRAIKLYLDYIEFGEIDGRTIRSNKYFSSHGNTGVHWNYGK